jgi:hypothetical protein
MLIRRWRCKGWGEVGIESVLRNRGEAAIRAEGKRPSEQRRSDIKIAGVMVSERGKEEKRKRGKRDEKERPAPPLLYITTVHQFRRLITFRSYR